MKILFENYKRLILPALIIVSGAFLLKNYFFPQFQIILGILIAPFVFKVKEKSGFSNRYFYVSIFFITAYYFLSMKLFLFLGIGTLLFYSIESRFGKIGLLPFIFLVSVSPAVHYVVNVFTFTLRLALSGYAADLMNIFGYPVQSNGNYFILPDGFTFNVDKACLGLNMYSTGLALTTLLLALIEKKFNKSLSFLQLSFVFISSCGLLIATNFLRIIVIVIFRSMPGTMSHELIGIFSLIIYMALPVYFLIHALIKHYGKKQIIIEKQHISLLYQKNIIFPLLALSFLFFSFTSVERSSKTSVKDLKLEYLELKGFSKTKKDDGVMEYRKDGLLLYIKLAVKAFESDHPPVLCWKGSGFNVEQISEISICDTKVLLASITKDNITQYTAWWYDNGTIKTIDQWTWRLSKGEPFRIINLTTTNKKDLLLNCELFMKLKMF